MASRTLIKEIKDKGIKHTQTKIYEAQEDDQEEKKVVTDPTEDLELKDLLDNCEPNAINFDNEANMNQTSMHH